MGTPLACFLRAHSEPFHVATATYVNSPNHSAVTARLRALLARSPESSLLNDVSFELRDEEASFFTAAYPDWRAAREGTMISNFSFGIVNQRFVLSFTLTTSSTVDD